MRKHNNKYWLKEKEYLSLESEYRSLDTRWPYMKTTRMSEVERKFLYKFFDLRFVYNAPKWYRKLLNQEQRSKQKRILYQIINVNGDLNFEDNYKDASWRYW